MFKLPSVFRDRGPPVPPERVIGWIQLQSQDGANTCKREKRTATTSVFGPMGRCGRRKSASSESLAIAVPRRPASDIPPSLFWKRRLRQAKAGSRARLYLHVGGGTGALRRVTQRLRGFAQRRRPAQSVCARAGVRGGGFSASGQARWASVKPSRNRQRSPAKRARRPRALVLDRLVRSMGWPGRGPWARRGECAGCRPLPTARSPPDRRTCEKCAACRGCRPAPRR